MISDEMRELLSAYVDGELRDADAARVEDVSKRDPELRREIEAYRTLRRKLREWDAAEHAVAPSPSMIDRTLARARVMDAALAIPAARSRFLGPLAAAAALLVAVGAGVLLARRAAPEAPPQPEPGTVLALKPPGPAPDLRLPDSVLAPMAEPPPAMVRSRLDDHLLSQRAVEFAEAMRRAETVRATPPEVRRTEPPVSLEVRALVEGYAPAGQPSAPLVLISHPPEYRTLEAIEPAAGRAINPSEGRIYPKLAEKGPAVVSPLGEVWMGPDKRVRLVARSEWIGRDAGLLIPVVSVDELKTSNDVDALEIVLGPRTRQRLLTAKPGLDAAFLAWLREVHGKDSLATLLADGAKDRERAVNRLVDALARSKGATGFAVLDTKGKLLGTELFLDHEVMLAFAPRLLRGYLLEAGEDGIRVGPPGVGGAEDQVTRLFEAMPGRGLKVDREALDVVFPDDLGSKTGTRRAPDGVERVTLYAASGQAVGHGLVHKGTPIHLALFGE